MNPTTNSIGRKENSEIEGKEYTIYWLWRASSTLLPCSFCGRRGKAKIEIVFLEILRDGVYLAMKSKESMRVRNFFAEKNIIHGTVLCNNDECRIAQQQRGDVQAEGALSVVVKGLAKSQEL